MKEIKTYNQYILICFIAISFLAVSCGGVVGNIEIYNFNDIPKKCIIQSINDCYLKNPLLIKSDTSLYGQNTHETFFFVSNISSKKYVFKVSVFSDSFGKTCMSLDTGAEWGDVMKLEPNLGYWQKRKWKGIFENNILKEIKNEINSRCLNI